MHRRVLFLLLWSAAALTGCADRVPVNSVRPGRPEEASLKPAKELLASESTDNSRNDAGELASSIKPVELVESNWNELQSLIRNQAGKIVVVDVWSTSCEPCMKEFPQLIALQKKYPNEVVAISFDVDYAGSKNKPVSYYRERVLKFLGSQPENTVTHLMCTSPADELFTEIKLDSIPAVYVYGRDSQLAKRFDGPNGEGEGVSYKTQVIPFVENIVKK